MQGLLLLLELAVGQVVAFRLSLGVGRFAAGRLLLRSGILGSGSLSPWLVYGCARHQVLG